MSQHKGLLTPEERARITELQDLLIDRFVEHKEAVADNREARAKELEAEIDGLLREKEEIGHGSARGSIGAFIFATESLACLAAAATSSGNCANALSNPARRASSSTIVLSMIMAPLVESGPFLGCPKEVDHGRNIPCKDPVGFYAS